jgi:aminomuconate-semialdehyde/2-hydroxymuconate-6-semialdehyde dehydrogenase
MDKIQNYIGGELVESTSGQWIDNAEPATGKVYSQIPDSNAADVDAAVAAANNAFAEWSSLPETHRAGHLHRIANQIDANFDELVEIESKDNGKPESLCRAVDIPRSSMNLRTFAGLITGFASESHAMPDAINYTLRKPLGAVGCISPWNLPLYLFTWKIAPALAAGNCVVAKPSEVTPYSAFRFSQLCIEAGLPPGVLNIVHGNGASAGSAIVEHPDIKAVSFTGGTKTGKTIASQIAPTFKKYALELGGKNPNIIFADCDYDEMLETTLRSSFANQGQICLCGSRILVEHSIYDRFRDDFVARTQQLVVSDPKSADSNLSAVVSRAHMEKILGCIELAKSEGGKILCGGEREILSGRCADGFFVQPTIIEGLANSCTTNQQEIFGPVVTIQPFSTADEAVELANDSQYGLAATVWTSNIKRGHEMADRIDAGVVWVNCWLYRDLRTPFGGMKQSGVGREGGSEALRFWTEPKNVCVKYL